jgi:prolipoprotein diacylglyceryltransferase
MSIHNILLGATLAILWPSRKHQKNLLILTDELVIPVDIIREPGRLGNVLDGLIAGSVCWAVKFPDVEVLCRRSCSMTASGTSCS